MIIVNFNRPEFEYDVHSLIKAFFPKEDVKLYDTCKEMEKNGTPGYTESDNGLPSKAYFENASQVFSIVYKPLEMTQENEKGNYNRISICWEKHGKVEFSVEGKSRKETKNALKQHLYNLLKQGLEKELPWGTLTGIRPTKIPMKLMEEGYSEKEIASYMKETYFATDEKIQLSIDIAKREKELLAKIDYENGYSLYIGIPFCPSTCLYCSFTSYPLAVWSKKIDTYLDALEKELLFIAVKFQHKKLNSVYIGGGTPTTLNPKQLDRLLRKIKCNFDLQHCVEFTVEAGRPDSITREKLGVLRQHGIDRISINPQTMKQETLDFIGRRHTVEQVVESFQIARELGFDNINMDLILGLPQETLQDVQQTMEQLKALQPDNITIHSLAVKRAARLNIFKDYYKDMQMINTQEHMDLCAAYCKEIGLLPYYLYRQKGMAGNMENVGYAKNGKAGVYNILIMEEKQNIVACGAGASTKRVWTKPNPDGTYRIERCENVKDVANYIDRIDEMIERKQRLFSE